MKPTDKILADLGYGIIRALGATLRFTEEGRENLDRARATGQPILFVFWHNRLLYLCYRLARERLVMMISGSRDGDLIARVARDHGIGAVRGSSTRGGSAAARALARVMKGRGVCGGITPDGPLGPRYEFQAGAVLVAKLAGALIVPVSIGFSGKKIFASWDGFILPRPFARARIVYGEPVPVPGDIETEAMDTLRKDIQRRLIAVTDAADRTF